jgi:hypothetical protein
MSENYSTMSAADFFINFWHLMSGIDNNHLITFLMQLKFQSPAHHTRHLTECKRVTSTVPTILIVWPSHKGTVICQTSFVSSTYYLFP